MGLQENFRKDTVRQLNLREAVTVSPTVTVRGAVEKMQSAKVGCVIVVDDDGQAVGVYNEAMLRNQLSGSRDFLDHAVSEHMATKFPWTLLTDSVETVLDAMQVNNTRFVVVLDENKKVVGLTGQKGLMEYVAEHFPQEVMVQYVGNRIQNSAREGA
ncbi:MAG: CBS domain-containing protein [Planctomycetaceae bacterium]